MLIRPVIISDLDGTLLESNGSVPNSFYDFLDLISIIKGDFIVASSRSPQNIKLLFKDFIDQFYAICSDGATVVLFSKSRMDLIKEINLDSQIVGIVCNTLLDWKVKSFFLFTNHSRGYEILWHNDGTHITHELFNYVIDGRTLRELTLADKVLHNDISRYSSIRCVSLFDYNSIIDDLYFRLQSNSLLNPLVKLYRYPESRYFNGTYSWLDIMPKGLSKGFVVKELKSSLLKNRSIVALGNGINDIELLLSADISYCPSNSDKEVLQISNTIIPGRNGNYFINMVIDNLKQVLYE